MKYILLLLATVSYSQSVQFSIGADVRNGLIGSEPTNNQPKLDFIGRFAVVHNNFEYSLIYENFNDIGFTKGALGFGKQIPLFDNSISRESKLKIIPTIELTMIKRNWDKVDGKQFAFSEYYNSTVALPPNKSQHLSVGFSLPIRYKVFDNFAVELQSNLLYRPDDNWRYGDGGKWVFSNHFNFIFNVPTGQN